MAKVLIKEDPKTGNSAFFEVPVFGFPSVDSIGCHANVINNVIIGIPSPGYVFGGEVNYSALGAFISGALFLSDKEIKEWYDEAIRPARQTPGITDYSKLADGFLDAIFEDVVKNCTKCVYVMVPVMNYGTLGRRGEGRVVSESYLTGRFAEYLVRKRVGHIIGGPLVNNPLYPARPGSKNVSLVQPFLWIPEPTKHLAVTDFMVNICDAKELTLEEFSQISGQTDEKLAGLKDVREKGELNPSSAV